MILPSQLWTTNSLRLLRINTTRSTALICWQEPGLYSLEWLVYLNWLIVIKSSFKWEHSNYFHQSQQHETLYSAYTSLLPRRIILLCSHCRWLAQATKILSLRLRLSPRFGLNLKELRFNSDLQTWETATHSLWILSQSIKAFMESHIEFSYPTSQNRSQSEKRKQRAENFRELKTGIPYDFQVSNKQCFHWVLKEVWAICEWWGRTIQQIRLDYSQFWRFSSRQHSLSRLSCSF